MEATKPLNGYIVFVDGQRTEVYAEAPLKAREQARAAYKGRKKNPVIHVTLAELGGQAVSHKAVD